MSAAKVTKLESNDMSSEQPDPPAVAGPVPGRATAPDLPRSIESALDEIFDKAGPPSPDMGWIAQAEPVRSIRPKPQSPPPVQMQPPPPRKSVALPVALGSLLAAAGLSGGVYLWRHAAWRPPQPLLALQALDAKAAPAAAPTLVAPPPGQAQSTVAPPSGAGDRAPAEPVISQPLPPVAARAEPPPVQAPPIEAPPQRRVAHVAQPSPHPPRDVTPEMRRLAADCDRGGACDHRTLARADQLLVAAYADAASSGVPTATLTDYRRRWDSLRNDGVDSPRILVGNYVLLAHDVNRSTSAARAGNRAGKVRNHSPEDTLVD